MAAALFIIRYTEGLLFTIKKMRTLSYFSVNNNIVVRRQPTVSSPSPLPHLILLLCLSRNLTLTGLQNKITHIRGKAYLSGAEEKISALTLKDGGHGDDDDDDDVRKASLGMGGSEEVEPH